MKLKMGKETKYVYGIVQYVCTVLGGRERIETRSKTILKENEKGVGV